MNEKIVKLQNELEKATDEFERLNVLSDLALQTYYVDPAKSVKLSQECLEISQKLNHKKGIINSKHLLSAAFHFLGDYEKSLTLSFEVLKSFAQNKTDDIKANCLNNIGNIYSELGNLPRSLEFYQKSLTEYKNLKSTQGEAALSVNIGILFMKMENFEKALEFFEKGLEISEKSDFSIGKSHALRNLGTVFGKTKQYEKALKFYRQGLFESSNRSKVNTLANIGDVFTETGEFEKAIENYKESLKLSQELSLKFDIAHALDGLGYANFLQGNYSQAIEFLEQSLEIATEINSQEILLNNFQKLTQVYEKSGDFEKALEFTEKFRKIDREIFNRESDKRFKNLQISYEVEVKELKIQKLKSEIEIQNQEMELQNRELTNFALNLSAKNEQLKKILKELEKVSEKSRSISDLKFFMKRFKKEFSMQNDWREFEEQFSKVHGDFLNRISQKFPKLTPRQLQICALLKTNLPSKEISDLLSVTLRSIEQQRYKIRKILGLAKDENLNEFLNSI